MASPPPAKLVVIKQAPVLDLIFVFLNPVVFGFSLQFGFRGCRLCFFEVDLTFLELDFVFVLVNPVAARHGPYGNELDL